MLRNVYISAIVMFLLASSVVWAQPTPPIMPKLQEVPLPPPVELTPPPSVPADVPNRPLTAEEASQIALHHQPSISAATGTVVSAQGRKQQAQSDLLPSLTTSAGYSNTLSSTAGMVTSEGFSVGATVRQLIFDFNHTRDLVRQASAQEQAAGANLTRAQSDLVLQTKQAFYTYQQNIRLVAVQEANLRNRQYHVTLAQARLKSGIGLPVDVVRAQTAVADAVLSLNLARTAASTSRVNLASFMGIDPRTPVQVAETGEEVPASENLDQLVSLGVKQRPEMLQASAGVQVAQYGLSAAKTSNSPAIEGTLGLTARGDNDPFDKNAVSVGVAAVFTPFDSGFTAGRVKEARGNVQTAQSELESTRIAVVSDVSQAYLNLKTAEQRVATADAEVLNAQEAERLAQGSYSAGLGTFIDVLDAQTALATAQANRVNAQSAVDQARAALAHSIGAPVP